MTNPGGLSSGINRDPPPFRQEPATADSSDGARVRWAWDHWDQQTAALLMRDRTIEECVRMLCGQQDIVWSAQYQRFVDVSNFLTDADRKWRHRPRLNRLLPWFLQTHARMTENPPILTFLPGPDAIDADLAETLDILFKAQWRDLGMQTVWDRLAAWMIVGGRAYLESRIDASAGEPKAWLGKASIPVVDPATGQMIPNPQTGEVPWLVEFDELPLGEDGRPLAVAVPGMAGIEPQALGEPHQEPEAILVPEVLCALEVRGEWGPQPWHEKRWHAKRSFLTPEQVWDRYGVKCQADTTGIGASSTGELERLLFGSGYYGAAGQRQGTEFSGGGVVQTGDGFVEVLTLWEAPNNAWAGYAQVNGSPGGRMLVVTRDKTLWDSVRPLPYRYTSPIRCFDFLTLPGRPSGTTPQEFLNPIQRAYNRTWGSITEHAAKMTNPMILVDKGAGLDTAEIRNTVGQKFGVARRPSVPAIEFVSPPPLGSDVYETLGLLRREFEDLGNLVGTDAAPPSKDASGRLVEELRYNGDRYIGPTMRRVAEEWGRVAEDWITIMPVIWPAERVIRYAGDDYVARTITVLPELFEIGNVNVQPDVESMLPEGRGERQAKALAMYREGLLDGPAGSPNAIKNYLAMAKFPNLARTSRPGGANRVTAEHILGRLLQGDRSIVQPQATGAPQLWWPSYDPAVHLDVLDDFINSVEFLRLDAGIQQLVMMRWSFVRAVMAQQMAAQQQQMMAAQQRTLGPGGGGGGGEGGRTPGEPPASGMFQEPAAARSSRPGYPTQFPST